MNIDENCIFRITNKLVSALMKELSETNSSEAEVIATLGKVAGIHNLAEELKAVLKA